MRYGWRNFEGLQDEQCNGFLVVGQPPGQLADGQGWQVDQQLREIELWIHVASTAGAGQAGEDSRSSPAARVAHEEPVLSIHHTSKEDGRIIFDQMNLI